MNRVVKQVRFYLKPGITLVLAIVLLGWITLPAHASSLAGLMALKSMSQEAVPYEVAISTSKPTVLEFYADWCSTCQSMAPMIQKLHEQYQNKINFVMLNIDDPQWLSQVEYYQVSGVPQLTVLDRHDAVVQTWVGRVPQPIVTELLARL